MKHSRRCHGSHHWQTHSNPHRRSTVREGAHYVFPQSEPISPLYSINLTGEIPFKLGMVWSLVSPKHHDPVGIRSASTVRDPPTIRRFGKRLTVNQHSQPIKGEPLRSTPNTLLKKHLSLSHLPHLKGNVASRPKNPSLLLENPMHHLAPQPGG